MHDPQEPYMIDLKRILRYVQGTLYFGLQFYSSSTTALIAYSGWVSDTTLLRSSVEAEYRGVANSVAETDWLRNLLRELHTPLQTANLVYCDNMSAIYMSTNPVQHQRTKHIKINIHFVRDKVTKGHVRVLHVPSRYQYPDIFTKRLPSTSFEEFHSSLSVRSSTARTAEECHYYNSRKAYELSGCVGRFIANEKIIRVCQSRLVVVELKDLEGAKLDDANFLGAIR
ncbi:ribonuclease H-like domain-containing protein [Tanacetum coccineum]